MRKITSLFVLFMAFCLAAVAADFVPTQGAKYLIRCKGNGNFALHNPACTAAADDPTVILSAWQQFDARSFFVIEGNATDGYTIRMANDETNYVYAVNTNDANSNVGVKAVTGSEVPADCKWKIVQQSDGWNIIPADGNNGWNVRGSYGGNNHIGQWSGNTYADNVWYIQRPSELVVTEADTRVGFPAGYSAEDKATATAVEANFTDETAAAFYAAWSAGQALVKPTSTSGLFKIKNNSLSKYLFQELDDKGITFSNDGGDNSKYYWKVDFNGNVATITSSAGTPLARGEEGKAYSSTGVITVSPVTLQGAPTSSESYTEGFFLFPGTHSTNQGIYTKKNAAYNSASNPYFLTTWTQTTGAANQYTFEEVVLAEGESVYTVNITGDRGAAPVVTYTGEGYEGNASVKNGGFFVLSSPQASQFTASNVDIYKPTVTIDEAAKTINVAYTEKMDNLAGYDASGNLTFESGYYYMIGVDETRRNKLFNDHLRAANTNDLTLQSATLGTTNNYIWKIEVSDDKSTVTIKNGQGTPIKTSAENVVSTFNQLTLDDYVAGKDGIYFAEALNNSNGHPFLLSDGTHYLTTWTDGGPEKDDNRWNFRPVDAGDAYTVAIHGMEDAYVTRTTTREIALNGGFFMSTGAPAAANFTPQPKDGYSSRVSVDATNKVITVNYVKLPVVGQYYRLKGAASGKYVTGEQRNAINGAARMAMEELNSVPADAYKYVYYLDNNNRWLSYMNGYYLHGTCELGGFDDEGNIQADSWTFAASATTVGALTLTSNYSGSKILYDNGNLTSKLSTDRNGQLAGANTDWFLEEVSVLPVTIGVAKYATLIAPVALEIPAEVTAYTAAFGEGKAMLTEIEDGIIPANTGVVLEAEAGTYNFDITTEAGTATTSDLTGYHYTTNVATDVTSYVLANPANDNGVGFYLLNDADRTIKGGRAYYEASADAAVQAFAISFGEVTGIDTIETAVDTDAPIYDLSGRRVVKLEKGIYIQNGRKIYVK